MRNYSSGIFTSVYGSYARISIVQPSAQGLLKNNPMCIIYQYASMFRLPYAQKILCIANYVVAEDSVVVICISKFSPQHPPPKYCKKIGGHINFVNTWISNCFWFCLLGFQSMVFGFLHFSILWDYLSWNDDFVTWSYCSE